MPFDILSDSMHIFLPELVMSAYKEFPGMVLGYIFISSFCPLVNEDRSHGVLYYRPTQHACDFCI